MHPAARVFTIAVVVVLVCSHLVLNVVTDHPRPRTVTRLQAVKPVVHQADVEGVNDAPANDAELGEEVMERIGDMRLAQERDAESAEREESEGTEETERESQSDKDIGGDGAEKVDEKAEKADEKLVEDVAKQVVKEMGAGEKDRGKAPVSVEDQEIMDGAQGSLDTVERKDEGEDCDGKDGEGGKGGESA